jgi:hypothetical protein
VASKNKTSTQNASEILKAQKAYATRVHKAVGGSNQQTYNNLVFANPPDVAVDFISSQLTTSFGKLHYLFLFSLNSNEDTLVFNLYSDAYKSVRDELARVERACHKSKVNFLDICSLTMERASKFVLEGKKKKGSYTFESELSDLAISLRVQHAKEVPDENHINILTEHFLQFGIEF